MPDQLADLIEDYGRNRACLAAAELDLQELREAQRQIEERICHAERECCRWQSKVESSRLAYNRRIDAQTEPPLADEVIKGRCDRALLSVTTQFKGDEWR